MAVMSFGGSSDPYLQQLQDILNGMNQGNLYPGSSQGVGMRVQRLTPEEEQSAYDISGYGGLLSNQDYGMVPEDKLTQYYSLSQPYMFGTGLENINQILSQAGYAPAGSPGQAASGTQAELAARLQASLGSQLAQQLASNAQTGATARANLGLESARSRYGTLTVPNITSLSGQSSPGAGSAVVQQSPMGQDPSAWLSGGTGFGSISGSGRSGSGSSGGGGGTSGTPWWQTSYGDMNAGQGAAWNQGQGGYWGSTNPYGSYLQGTGNNDEISALNAQDSQYEYTQGTDSRTYRRLRNGGQQNPWTPYTAS